MLCADEKPSIQARRRKHAGTAPAANRPMRVEHEYAREGACTYIAAWDVHRAKVFGTCVPRSGIAHFDGLVADVMARPPYDRARRVFWIMDNASIHRGQRCVDRFRQQWPAGRVLHTPIHASWLNQVEVYFSIVQRKVLTPNDFPDPSTISSDDCSNSSATTRRSPVHSSGSSRETTCATSCDASRPPICRWPRRHDRIRHRTCGLEY